MFELLESLRVLTFQPDGESVVGGSGGVANGAGFGSPVWGTGDTVEGVGWAVLRWHGCYEGGIWIPWFDGFYKTVRRSFGAM